MSLSVSPCPSCGTVHPVGHNFCSNCGASLRTSPCPACGGVNPLGSVVCEKCGSFLREYGDQSLGDELDERKFITAFFVDIKGSVELLGERDIEEGRHLIDSVILQTSSLIHRHEGTVIDTVGDGVFAIFGAPRSLDGHPRAAVNAALEIQEQMRANDSANSLLTGIQLRIGIFTGDVIWRVLQVGRDLRHLPVGQTVNQASRLQDVAEPGSVLIGESTYELVKDYFSFTPVTGLKLKGIPGTVKAYKVVKPSDVFRHLQVSIKRGLSPLVGRERELGILADSLQGLERGMGGSMVLVSEAGGGKSRLLHEATQRLAAKVHVIEAFCISHMQSSPWYSVVQLIRQLFGISPGMSGQDARLQILKKIRFLDPVLEDELPTLLQFLDLDPGLSVPVNADPTARKRRYISLIKRLLSQQAKISPLLVIIEDLHWLDLQSADVVDAIGSLTEDNPIFLLCTSRPEGVTADWREREHTLLPLGNLDLDAARELMKSLLPSDVLSERLILEIQNKTQGNPFFIEEIIRSQRWDALSTREKNDANLIEATMPSTIKMAIADRIDRLSQLEKKVLQILAVVGMKCRVFLLTKLMPSQQEEIMDVLEALQVLGFVVPSNPDNQPHVQFVHVLIQEVAYSSLLSGQRAGLHESIADTIKAEYAELTQEILPELAYHYQQSTNDGKAVEHLRLAGESAIQRSAHQEAQNYLKLGLARLEKARKLSDRLPQFAHIWLSLGVSLQVTLGYAAEEVRTAYEHAVDYGEKAQVLSQLLEALRGYGIFNIVRANYAEAARIADRLKRFAKGDAAFALEHLILHGLSSSYRGDLDNAAKYYKKGIAISSSPLASTTIQYSGYSPGICYSYYALNRLFAGRLRLARDYAEKGLEVASANGIPIAVAQSRGMLAHVLFCFREFPRAEELNLLNIAFADENGFAYWSLLGRLLNTWTSGYLRHNESALGEFQAYLAAYRGSGALIGVPWFLNLYAELLWHVGRTREALVVLGESEGIASLTQERFFLVDTLRLKGELHSALSDNPISIVAIQCFQEAINLARVQGAWLPGFRAAMPLARLLCHQGAAEEARELFSFHYKQISWVNCPDNEEARALMKELSLDL
jgi:class 3 adenylate cyclase/tetratricopeptide (TPR) repeat protein